MNSIYPLKNTHTRMLLYPGIEWTNGNSSINDNVTKALLHDNTEFWYQWPGVIQIKKYGMIYQLDCQVDENDLIFVYANIVKGAL